MDRERVAVEVDILLRSSTVAGKVGKSGTSSSIIPFEGCHGIVPLVIHIIVQFVYEGQNCHVHLAFYLVGPIIVPSELAGLDISSFWVKVIIVEFAIDLK